MRTWLYKVSLLDGWLPLTLGILCVLAGIFLLLRFKKRWPIWVAAGLLISIALSFIGGWATVHVFNVWPEDLPTDVLWWSAMGIGGVLLAVGHFFFRGRWWRKILATIAAVVVLSMAGLQVNAYFGYMPTVGDLLGHGPVYIKGLPNSLKNRDQRDPSENGPVVDRWKRPAVLKKTGEVIMTPIPGTLSGFHARDAFVYLPPAYLAAKRPNLPVLIMLPGQPGEPSDWTVSGQLTQTMDAFAAAHNGLAPIVVMPDPNATVTGNTMCMDSNIARADTYVSKDVPNWIKKNLVVDDNPQHWAVGGFSFGATCAVQMATRHPNQFPTLMAFSSEVEPALSVNRANTIETAFGGNTAEFDSLMPMTLLAKDKFPHSRGFFAAGDNDAQYISNATALSAAAKKAGMVTELKLVAGAGHSWAVAHGSLMTGINFIAHTLGLVK